MTTETPGGLAAIVSWAATTRTYCQQEAAQALQISFKSFVTGPRVCADDAFTCFLLLLGVAALSAGDRAPVGWEVAVGLVDGPSAS
jgi:hypothetical protein